MFVQTKNYYSELRGEARRVRAESGAFSWAPGSLRPRPARSAVLALHLQPSGGKRQARQTQRATREHHTHTTHTRREERNTTTHTRGEEQSLPACTEKEGASTICLCHKHTHVHTHKHMHIQYTHTYIQIHTFIHKHSRVYKHTQTILRASPHYNELTGTKHHVPKLLDITVTSPRNKTHS